LARSDFRICVQRKTWSPKFAGFKKTKARHVPGFLE
jgi:hypothetical protein